MERYLAQKDWYRGDLGLCSVRSLPACGLLTQDMGLQQPVNRSFGHDGLLPV